MSASFITGAYWQWRTCRWNGRFSSRWPRGWRDTRLFGARLVSTKAADVGWPGEDLSGATSRLDCPRGPGVARNAFAEIVEAMDVVRVLKRRSTYAARVAVVTAKVITGIRSRLIREVIARLLGLLGWICSTQDSPPMLSCGRRGSRMVPDVEEQRVHYVE
jgi:hypothetical protein